MPREGSRVLFNATLQAAEVMSFGGLNVLGLTVGRRGAYNAAAACLAAWCRRGRRFAMNNNTPTKVVTILAIVWYVLEIFIKTVQLLR